MTEKALPAPGQRVRFHDGDSLISGVCNGEPLMSDECAIYVYVPVYVHEGDRCLMVAAENIVEEQA